MIKVCEVCGKEFEAKRSDAKYCSKKCRQNKSVRAKRGSFSKKVCLVCGKEFNGHNNAEACSNECRDIIKVQMDFQKDSKKAAMNNWE